VDYILAVLTAIWLGILTSISPCPLTTNIAAVSYISRRIGRKDIIFISGLLYTAGRMAAYTILGALLVSSILEISPLSQFLQKYMSRLLGPILIICGMFLLRLIEFNIFSSSGISEKMLKRVDKMGMAGAAFLGFIFALTFCPISAALFFGSLLTIALKHSSRFVMPSAYGLGTALPVIFFSIVLGMGTNAVGKAYSRIKTFEIWSRNITGGLFIIAGIYISLKYIFGIL